MPHQINYYHRIASALAVEPVLEEVTSEKLRTLLDTMRKSVSCHKEMLYLPLMTCVCSLMGKAEVTVRRENVRFKEPNVLWSFVAADPGSRKSVAMHLLTDALDRVEEELLMESGDSDSRVYNANESITEAKLHEELMASDGTYFFIHDEIEGFLESLDNSKAADAKDCKWLSLHGGGAWTKNTRSGRTETATTRVSYTGYMQPELLVDRLLKFDKDALLDRHWFMVVERKQTMFEEIGKDATSDAAELLKAVYLQHKQAAGDINRYLLTEDATAELMAYHNAKEVQIGELLRSGEAGYNERKMHIGSLSKASGNGLRMGMIIQAAEDAILDVEQKEKNDTPDQGSSVVEVTMKAEKDVSAAEVEDVEVTMKAEKDVSAAEVEDVEVTMKEEKDVSAAEVKDVEVTMKEEQDVSAAEVKEVCKESIVKSISLIEYLLSVRRALLEEEKAPSKTGILQIKQAAEDGQWSAVTDEELLKNHAGGIRKLINSPYDDSTRLQQYKHFDTSKGSKSANVKGFMVRVAKVGLGDVFEGEGTSKQSLRFRKRKAENLPPHLAKFAKEKKLQM